MQIKGINANSINNVFNQGCRKPFNTLTKRYEPMQKKALRLFQKMALENLLQFKYNQK